jgi:hypothetical protein
LGGKAGCAPASRLLVEAGETFAEKPLAPLADDLARRIQASGNEVVRQPVGRQQDEFGANDVTSEFRLFSQLQADIRRQPLL